LTELSATPAESGGRRSNRCSRRRRFLCQYLVHRGLHPQEFSALLFFLLRFWATLRIEDRGFLFVKFLLGEEPSVEKTGKFFELIR
jgi:hypothetical protein